jgi:hypothetical protein
MVKSIKILKILVFISAIILPIITFAQTQYNLIEPLPGIQQVGGESPFVNYVSKLIPFLLAFAALAAFMQIVFGGILRATSRGNPSAIGDANYRIWQAILGLVLALSAYLILYTVNPDLVSLRFFPTPIKIESTATGGAGSLTPAEKEMLGKRSYTRSGCESECKSSKLKCLVTTQSSGFYECVLIQVTQ